MYKCEASQYVSDEETCLDATWFTDLIRNNILRLECAVLSGKSLIDTICGDNKPVNGKHISRTVNAAQSKSNLYNSIY